MGKRGQKIQYFDKEHRLNRERVQRHRNKRQGRIYEKQEILIQHPLEGFNTPLTILLLITMVKRDG